MKQVRLIQIASAIVLLSYVLPFSYAFGHMSGGTQIGIALVFRYFTFQFPRYATFGLYLVIPAVAAIFLLLTSRIDQKFKRSKLIPVFVAIAGLVYYEVIYQKNINISSGMGFWLCLCSLVAIVGLVLLHQKNEVDNTSRGNLNNTEPSNMKQYCPHCGNKHSLTEGSQFCESCGYSLKENS